MENISMSLTITISSWSSSKTASFTTSVKTLKDYILIRKADSRHPPPPTPYHTSSTTILQPANQVASCSPTRTIPLPQATFTIRAMGRRNAPRSMSQ
ncbi:hypothetical protein TNCV_4623591 [Trichonephila clavipes]|nr:hypothetical protein TNCV_4623591 [Trichonephila clavipes]